MRRDRRDAAFPPRLDWSLSAQKSVHASSAKSGTRVEGHEGWATLPGTPRPLPEGERTDQQFVSLQGMEWDWLSMDGSMTKAPRGEGKNRLQSD